MFVSSVKHSIEKRLEASLDNFLIRTLYVLMVINNHIPKPVAKSKRVGYYAVIGFAFALTAMLYLTYPIIDATAKARELLSWLHKMEYRVEFYVKTHHLFLVLAALAYAFSVARVGL